MRRVFRKPGNPTKLNQATAASTSNTPAQTAKRAQVKTIRHLRQNPVLELISSEHWPEISGNSRF